MDQEKKCKIVVFGAFGAGKTTLIKTLDPGSSHVEANVHRWDYNRST